MGVRRRTFCWPFFLLYLLPTFFPIQVSHAEDTLSHGQSIADGQTLISSGENFILGFFSPSNSPNRYVGIWYTIPEQTVVWVANPQNPIPDKSGILTITPYGNSTHFTLFDGTRRRSHTLATIASATNRTSAKLLDTGNLVFKEENPDSPNQILWQSFDYPTDTLLPHMKMGLNKNTKRNQVLTSWRSSEDPAPGDYSMGLDPNGTSQYLIWKRGSRIWANGIRNGEMYAIDPLMTSSYVFNFSYESDEKGNYFSYWPYDSSIKTRLVMDVSGQLKQLTWSESRGMWVLLWTQPKPSCDVFNLCGAFGLCSQNAFPTCQCLKGYEPASVRNWSEGVWSGGCENKTGLKCHEGHGSDDRDSILKMPNLRYPDNPVLLSAANDVDCRLACLEDCSCNAYAYDRKCYVWRGDLFNMQLLLVDDSRGRDLYLRLPTTELTRSKDANRMKLWMIIVVIAAITILAILLGIVTCHSRRRKIKQKEMRESHGELSSPEPGSSRVINIIHKLEKSWNKGSQLQVFSFAHIVAATDNFSSTNKLGQGGFGPVYKGKLLEGQEIAVKRLSESSGQGLEEFVNEVILIAKVQHMNLVRLLGCCTEGEEKMLIYEYMPNKSLDIFLTDPIKKEQLEWRKRVRIIDGIAQGLLYLHTYSRLRIIHRDLKPSNILLDDEMKPKISDFGMARIFGRNESKGSTNRVVGTYGYMSPEYAMRGLFSEKSDVYSFGVLVLEIICGKKNSSFYDSERSLYLLGYAWEIWKEGKSFELVDPALSGSYLGPELTRYIHVALLCVQERASDRPLMSDVTFMLKNEGSLLPAANQPAFISTSSFKARMGIEKQETSINDVTASVLEAR